MAGVSAGVAAEGQQRVGLVKGIGSIGRAGKPC